MWDILAPFAAWLGATPFALWVGGSTDRIAWLFTAHLFGMVFLLGGTICLCLRMLSLVLRQTPVQAVARAVLPFSTIGLAIMIASGFIIFSGGAVAYFAGPLFRLKMVLLAIAIAFQFSVFRKVATADEGRFSPGMRGGVAIAGLLIWFSVACAGRAIAFF